MQFEHKGTIVEIINPEAIPTAKIAVAKLILKLAERNNLKREEE